MNVSRGFFPTDASNSSSIPNEMENNFSVAPVLFFLNVLLSFPINSYVIWLIVTGAGNGLALEFFGLNLSICEIFIAVQSVFFFLSYEYGNFWKVVYFLDGLGTMGRPLFQFLMSVECYLAVVHPVTFLKSKPLRYRLICCVFVWVVTFCFCGVSVAVFMVQHVIQFSFLLAEFFIFLSIEVVCSWAVLRALKKSGPGDRKKAKQENYMKRQAFNFVLITTVAILILYAPYVVLISLFRSSDSDPAFFMSFTFTLAGLLQPLLFLYRVRKLPFLRFQ